MNHWDNMTTQICLQLTELVFEVLALQQPEQQQQSGLSSKIAVNTITNHPCILQTTHRTKADADEIISDYYQSLDDIVNNDDGSSSSDIHSSDELQQRTASMMRLAKFHPTAWILFNEERCFQVECICELYCYIYLLPSYINKIHILVYDYAYRKYLI